ncbi:MAG: hypothetical protein AAGE93_02885 [Bacteroidota bacterium]
MQLINRYCTATLTDGIVHVQYRPFLHITLEDAQFIVEDRIRFFKDLRFPVLIKEAKIKSIDKAARHFLFDTQLGLKNINAIAFIESNKVDRMILKMIFHQYTPSIPHNSFQSEAKALVWLAQHR